MVLHSNTHCSTCAARFNLAHAVALCRRGSRRGGGCGGRVARDSTVHGRAARGRAADRPRHPARQDALEATVVGNAVARQVTPEQAVVLLEPLVLAVRDLVPGRVALNAPVVSASVMPLLTAVLASRGAARLCRTRTRTARRCAARLDSAHAAAACRRGARRRSGCGRPCSRPYGL
ncbi:unnamed protein product [Prorocentrum cordatum]|uniref:Uncharacterized protein n=1 Tax=Prorocentrum cordatum TaxID=2364126 RepID=A0ABN9XQM5_9DINO|nr:unnamed protein product [Polarella glacialis]